MFQHDIVYGDFKNLTRRIPSDKILHDKAFSFAKLPKYDWHQTGLASMFSNFFDRRTSVGAIKNEIMSNKKLAEELHKRVIRKI